ncbi:MAG: discoidin domain-containing protein [Candidatus Sumerlaeaceae bacterium]|nr:discoidin domain-containing protein [Candidatus Sumerlaeaceae bacterium]
MPTVTVHRMANYLLFAACILVPAGAYPQTPAHIYGIHDDTPTVNQWTGLCPSAWITATEALGTNPSDLSGKAYSPPPNTKIIARLNKGYFPNGTIPVPAQFANFAARCANFVVASTNCDTWVIGNETNLAVEWPNDGGSNLVYISPTDYANCFKQCFNAIKAVRPTHKVLVQALAPWGGPYGAGNIGGYNHPAQPDNWCDYMHKMLTAITTGPGAVTPDGIALHINTRGWNPATVFNPGPYVDAGPLTLDFSWGVMRDWIQFGTPRNLWNLPLYATESNGLYYWQGGGPVGPGDPAYVTGWLQKAYAEVNAWNQTARNFGLPIYRCVNMYRWPNADGWTIEAAPNRPTILADLSSAAAQNYTWPPFGGNSVNLTAPGGTRIATGITATADSTFGTGFEPAKAFDGSLATKWTSTNTNPTHFLIADLGSVKTITGYVVRHASAGGESTNFNTLGFYIETSTAGTGGPWTINTVVRTANPGGTPPASTMLAYTTPVSARYVRLFINDPGGDAYARIPEFEIYQVAPASETIVDNLDPGFVKVSGTWTDSSFSPGYWNTNYTFATTVTGTPTALCRWTPPGLAAGTYAVYVWYVSGANRAPDAPFVVNHASGSTTVFIDQTVNGSQWVPLGQFTLNASSNVELSNLSSIAGRAALADAVRFVSLAGVQQWELY